MDADRVDAEVTGCAAAHQRLLADLDELTDEQVRSASLLPKWTVGHVLNHLVRNAESMIRVFAAAGNGLVVERYAGGMAGRNAGVEDGADRPAGELVGDVRSTIWRLEQSWATAPAEAWQGRSVETSGREIPVSRLPFLRWREVEVHHADLGLGFSFDDWSDAYVAAELAEQLPKIPDRLGANQADDADTDDAIAALREGLGDRRFLAWIIGRWSRADLPDLAAWQ
jgi:maleylpyruvate isomerase